MPEPPNRRIHSKCAVKEDAREKEHSDPARTHLIALKLYADNMMS